MDRGIEVINGWLEVSQGDNPGDLDVAERTIRQLYKEDPYLAEPKVVRVDGLDELHDTVATYGYSVYIVNVGGHLDPGWYGGLQRDMDRLGVQYGPELFDIARNASLAFTASDLVVLVGAPEEVHLRIDSLREPRIVLHKLDGPAVRWRDGSMLYMWDDRVIPPDIAKGRNDLTLRDIVAIADVDLRATVLRHVPLARVLERSGGWVRLVDRISRDEVVITEGRDGTPLPVGLRGAELLEADAGFDMPVRIVRLRCPSTGKEHVHPVPPHVSSVVEAVSWMWDVDPVDYLGIEWEG